MKSFKSVYFSLIILHIIFPQNTICGLGAVKSIMPNSNTIKIDNMKRLDSGVFKVRNLITNSFDEIEFDLIIENSEVKFYVQRTEIENGNVDVSIIEDIFDEFISASFQINNIEYDDGILGAEKSILGNLPEFSHSDNSVNILFVDIQDGSNQSNEFVSGFFDPADQELCFECTESAGCSINYIFDESRCNSPNAWGSAANGKNILYIDTNPLSVNTENYQNKLFVIAHELQHLLHWHSDKKEGYFASENMYLFHNPWLNEGLSDLMASLLGYGERSYSPFLKDITIGLDEWAELGSASTLPYYAKSALFMKFLYEYYGIDIINEIFHHEKEGIESISEIIELNDAFIEWTKSLSVGLIGNAEIDDYGNVYQLDSFFSMGRELYEFTRTIDIPPYSFYPLGLPEFIKYDSISVDVNHTMIQSTNNAFIDDYGVLNRIIYFALEDSLKNIESTFYYKTITSPDSRRLFIYPHPVTSSDLSYLQFFGNETDLSTNIKIVSVRGENISEESYQLDLNQNLVIDFNPNLPSGTYMVSARSNSIQENIKISVIK